MAEAKKAVAVAPKKAVAVAPKKTEAVVEKKVEEVKKVAAPKKEAAPKKAAAPKKEAAPKKATAVVMVQYGDKEVNTADLSARALDAYKAETGKTAKEVKVYLKVSENKAYYVADEYAGSFDI